MEQLYEVVESLQRFASAQQDLRHAQALEAPDDIAQLLGKMRLARR